MLLAPCRRRCAGVLLLLLAALTLSAHGAELGKAAPPPEPRQIQAAIDGALAWLAQRQIQDGPDAGSWQCAGYRSATTSFAGLAFLANGHLPGQGPYGQVVDRAMRFVQKSMTPDGYLGGQYEAGMYVHAICTLFGLSYLGMSQQAEQERELAEWCRKSVKVILEAQQVRKAAAESGGWRYKPYLSESDVSVTSWQLLVLHAARQCGYVIDEAVFESAMRYVNSAYAVTPIGEAGFVYRPGFVRTPEPSITGVAVFLKSLLEKDADEKTARASEYLSKFPPAWGGRQYKGYFFFGTFYMVQGMFQLGEEAWKDFAPKIQRVLIDHQEGDGRWDFPPDNKFESRQAGLPYATAMGVLILSLDKQYLPMYQRQKRLF